MVETGYDGGPHVVLKKEELELVLRALPLTNDYSSLRARINKALDGEWEKRQYPKGRIT